MESSNDSKDRCPNRSLVSSGQASQTIQLPTEVVPNYACSNCDMGLTQAYTRENQPSAIHHHRRVDMSGNLFQDPRLSKKPGNAENMSNEVLVRSVFSAIQTLPKELSLSMIDCGQSEERNLSLTERGGTGETKMGGTVQGSVEPPITSSDTPQKKGVGVLSLTKAKKLLSGNSSRCTEMKSQKNVANTREVASGKPMDDVEESNDPNVASNTAPPQYATNSIMKTELGSSNDTSKSTNQYKSKPEQATQMSYFKTLLWVFVVTFVLFGIGILAGYMSYRLRFPATH